MAKSDFIETINQYRMEELKMNINTKKQVENHEIKVTRAKELEYQGKKNIVFDMIVNGVTIYNCKLLNKDNAYFVGFPSVVGTDKEGKDRYYNRVYVKLTPDDITNIVDQIEKM